MNAGRIGTAEREAAIEMIGDLLGDGRITLGADKGYDTQGVPLGQSTPLP